MNRDEARTLLAGLLRRIAPEIDLASVADDALVQDELDIDSMDFLRLVDALRAEGVEVPDHDFPELATVGGFVDYLARAPRSR